MSQSNYRRLTWTLAIVIGLIGGLVGRCSAQAGVIQRSVAIAEQVFPGHCDGHERVMTGDVANVFLQNLGEDDADTSIGAAVLDGSCTEYIRTRVLDPEMECLTAIHEKGHLEGLGHPDEGAPPAPDPRVSWIMDSRLDTSRVFMPCATIAGPNPLAYVRYTYPSSQASQCDPGDRGSTTCIVFFMNHYVEVRVDYSRSGRTWSVEPVGRG